MIASLFRRSGNDQGVEESVAAEKSVAFPVAPSTRDARHQHALRSLKIMSRRALENLERLDVVTVGDLLELDFESLGEAGFGDREIARLRVSRRAVRLALVIRRLNPRNARLLIAVHRGSPERLALTNAVRLQKDIQRFALSSRGSRLIGDMPLPPVEVVREWIESATNHERRNALKT